MIYQWLILGALALAVAGLLMLALRSRARQNEYLGAQTRSDLSTPSPERLRAEAKLTEVEGRNEAPAPLASEPITAPPVTPISQSAPDPAAQPIVNPWSEIPVKTDVANPNDHQPITDHITDHITGADQIESEYDEAELMLREVKAMLLQGRPDRAIAHIRAATGVDHEHAAEFVADVQSRVIG
jgi:hypothetical protein